MKSVIKLSAAIVATHFLSGCVTIGQEDFTCGNLKRDGVCAGPRDIYELTNNRESLEGLTIEELHNQVHKDRHGNTSHVVKKSSEQQDNNNVYEARTNEQHTSMDYQTAQLVPEKEVIEPKTSEFSRWPSNGEPLAPEALAVMEEPKPLRIMVNSYTDAMGVFHVPGFAYVNTQKATWVKGAASDLRPTRVVPLQLRQKSDKNMQRINRQRQGVSPLGVMRGGEAANGGQR